MARILLLFVVSVLWPAPVDALEAAWWSSIAQLSAHYTPNSNNLLGAKPFCSQLTGLSPGQHRICDLFIDHMPAVGQGAQEAISECEHQFKQQRWNCSTPSGSGYVGPIHKRGTKEAAFTYAILSAGVTHEIGRRCRLGLLGSCGCSEADRPDNLHKDWTWGGCGDNVDYGYRFAKDFIDVREKEKSFPKRSNDHGRSLMNRWNNEVGRRVTKKLTRPRCKCHGVSGSCNLKTCWMQMPTTRQLGDALVSKYRTARRIQINQRGNMQIVGQPDKRDKSDFSKQPKQNFKSELVFLDDSPDYCRTDIVAGTTGTQGRPCKRGSSGPDSCDMLCCGRGYNTFTEETHSKCKCKFQWCCYNM
uniref:Protein Wnt n=1 Tax=Plectus sambesii TaxID=2011161 RepID=A0A914WAU9_9BILA